MMNFMEEAGQHYNQCVEEIKRYHKLIFSIQRFTGPMVLLYMSNDGISEVFLKQTGVSREHGADMRTHQIILN